MPTYATEDRQPLTLPKPVIGYTAPKPAALVPSVLPAPKTAAPATPGIIAGAAVDPYVYKTTTGKATADARNTTAAAINADPVKAAAAMTGAAADPTKSAAYNWATTNKDYIASGGVKQFYSSLNNWVDAGHTADETADTMHTFGISQADMDAAAASRVSPPPPPPGIIAKAAAPQVERATTERVALAPDMTVKQQAYNTIAEDSPLMQQARAGALMQANERGMVNSSLGIGAAQAAVMDRAIDMGKQDANTNLQVGTFNADAANKTSMFNAGQGNQWNTNQLDRDWKTSEREATQNWTAEQKSLDRQATVDQYKFDATTQKDLKDISFKYQKELDSDGAFNDQYKMYVDALFKIDSDPNLDAPAKLQLKHQQAVAFESYATMKGLKLNLDFSGMWEQTPEEKKAATLATTIKDFTDRGGIGEQGRGGGGGRGADGGGGAGEGDGPGGR